RKEKTKQAADTPQTHKRPAVTDRLNLGSRPLCQSDEMLLEIAFSHLASATQRTGSGHHRAQVDFSTAVASPGRFRLVRLGQHQQINLSFPEGFQTGAGPGHGGPVTIDPVDELVYFSEGFLLLAVNKAS